MDGILLVDKPAGWTSFDVVAKVRSTLRSYQSSVIRSPSEQTTDSRKQAAPSRKVKVGHTGTLDPLATGLLVLMIGKYTKKVPEFTKLDKTYEVRMRLGQVSTTGDDEGEKTDVSDLQPSRQEVEAALQKFVGNIMQTPPVYSAIKINGRRAYDLARKGKVPEMQPRPAKIYEIELKKYEYPFVEFTAEVGSGTYIRSLVEDVGKELRTGAYMPALRRTKVGDFKIEDAMRMEELSQRGLHKRSLSDRINSV
jgi:tRNA pseudouridine55 synthase